MIRVATRLCWLLVSVVAPAAAQQPSSTVNPVVANFREYRAALERNDLPAAEKAAEAALAASEAAGGARTAVLALNLANVRLGLGGDYDALEPARRAYELATASADAGVDPRVATLTLGRAELAANEERDGSRRLIAAIPMAEGDAAIAGDVYDAAVALAQWALEAREYDDAESAWATAERLADTSVDPTFARARAITGRGVAIFLRSANPREQQTGTRLLRISTPEAQAASDAFASAQSLLMPAAYAEIPPGTRLTAGQVAYAQAMAWQGALLARQETLDEAAPVTLPTMRSIPVYDGRGLCRMRAFNAGPELKYPTEALFRYGVGAVVMHFALEPDGTVRSRSVAASVPPGLLGEAVEATLDNWRIEKTSGSPPNCRAPPSLYYVVRFVIQ